MALITMKMTKIASRRVPPEPARGACAGTRGGGTSWSVTFRRSAIRVMMRVTPARRPVA
jgi:hypothetical protein